MALTAQLRNGLCGAVLVMGAGLLALPAMAHPGMAAQARGHHQWPQLNLRAQASAEVEQDTVKITLASELSDASQSTVVDALSKTVDSAMGQAKTDTRVKVSSGNYRVWPVSDKDGKITNWHGRGEIYLESTDFAAASELAAQLADRMPIANLNFFVSPQQRAKTEQALLGEAAQAFLKRAQNAAQAFGFESYTVRSIDLQGEGASYRPAPQMMAMMASKASVPLEGGTETVTVSVSGSIFLHSTKK